MKLLPYHFGLALKGLRRDPAVSLIMLVALGMGGGFWSLAVSQYTRYHGYGIHLRPTLHQVEIVRPRDANSVFLDRAAGNPYMAPTAIRARTQVSYREHRLLEQSQAPAQQSAGVRAEVIVRGPAADQPPKTRLARFTNTHFFPLFERPFSAGGPWSPAQDHEGSAVVVLGLVTSRQLFPGGDAVGRTIHVDGHPFRVVGVLSRHQPLNAPWQLLLTGGSEDALFLPLAAFDRIGARPLEPLLRSPTGRGRGALLASDALFVNRWVDLPTAGHVERYRRDLDRLLGSGGYVLRSLEEWRREMAVPTSQIGFFSIIGVVVLLGGGFNLARWLLMKGLSRGAELGVYRALGAPRSSLFWRTVAEAGLLAVPAALLAPLAALPYIALFNRYVRVVDMPLELNTSALLASVIPPLVICLLGAVYPAWRLARIPPTIYLGRP